MDDDDTKMNSIDDEMDKTEPNDESIDEGTEVIYINVGAKSEEDESKDLEYGIDAGTTLYCIH